MNLNELSKPLPIDRVDFRVQSVNNGGYATILAYKDARVDMDRLDEVVGKNNWQKKYEIINGSLYCSVGIYDSDKKEWIWKQDVGSESNTEAEKGVASDSFKRACVNWGIGRELYAYPMISVKLDSSEIDKSKPKPTTSWGFKLKEWKWSSSFTEEGSLISLVGVDTSGVERFRYTRHILTKVQFEATLEAKPDQIKTVLDKFDMTPSQRSQLEALV